MDEMPDSHIRRVVGRASHPHLCRLDVAVLDRIAGERVARARAWRLDAIYFAGALMIGVATSVTFAAPPSSSTSSTLAGLSPLAPSVLLERHR